MIKYFVCHEDEFHRIDQALESRNLTSDDVISIVKKDGDMYFVFYKC